VAHIDELLVPGQTVEASNGTEADVRRPRNHVERGIELRPRRAHCPAPQCDNGVKTSLVFVHSEALILARCAPEKERER
jgi:hypothetical protein